VSQKLGAALYAEQQATAGAAGDEGATGAGEGAGGGDARDDDVVDAEIVDEDEKK